MPTIWGSRTAALAGKVVSEAVLSRKGVKKLTEDLLAQTADVVGGGGRGREGGESGHLELDLENSS